MRVFLTMLVAAAMTLPHAVHAFDTKAAEKVLRDNKCFRCHAVIKEKAGPTYLKIAEKFRGKSDAEQSLIVHMTTWPTVEVHGSKEKHKKIKADDAAIKNLAQWILSHY